jgi:hypothetical protein
VAAYVVARMVTTSKMKAKKCSEAKKAMRVAQKGPMKWLMEAWSRGSFTLFVCIFM